MCSARAMKRNAKVGDGPSPCSRPRDSSNLPSAELTEEISGSSVLKVGLDDLNYFLGEALEFKDGEESFVVDRWEELGHVKCDTCYCEPPTACFTDFMHHGHGCVQGGVMLHAAEL